MNNEKTVLTLVAAIVLTAGIVVTAMSIAAPAQAHKCTGEKDTRSCPNFKECTVRTEEGKLVEECREGPHGH
jgi:hypothetical protein